MWQLDKTLSQPYKSNAHPGALEIEIISSPASYVDHGSMIRPWFNGMMTSSYIMQPDIRGWVTLKSKDPFEYPVLEPNYFSSPTDVQCMVRGLRIALQIARSQPLADRAI